MLDFDTARAELLNWYRLGNPSGTRAFERFYREWLAPQTKMIAARSGFRPDDVDDVLQRLAIAFADREKMSGLEANSVTFWHRRIKWELESARRRARIHEKRYNGQQETQRDADGVALPPREAESPEPTPEATIADADETAVRAVAVRAALPTLSEVERLAYLVFTWPDYAELLTAADFAELAARTDRSQQEVRAALDAALASRDDANEWSRRTAAVLFPLNADSDRKEWIKALDAYRQARARAVERLQKALKRAFDGGIR